MSEVPNELPTYAEIAAASRGWDLAIEPAELHGALCGWLAAGGENVAAWPARVLADDELPQPAAGSDLDRLRTVSVTQLEDRSFAFELLLPDASAPTVERAEALLDWCRGFLGGFGLAGGNEAGLSEEGGEALQDLARLAQASPEDGDDEEDQDALAEIEEYVRVAVLLLHGDCVMGPRHRKRLN
jgi:uncharacterized protein YgfB (UPF0149 family)